MCSSATGSASQPAEHVGKDDTDATDDDRHGEENGAGADFGAQ
jgi:hypothetical protein